MSRPRPSLYRFYIRECLLGIALGIGFSMALVVLNVGNIGYLIDNVDGGWLAFLMLCFFNGVVFAGVQSAISVMRIAKRGDD